MTNATTLTTQGIILFAHGGTSPAWAQPFRQIQAVVQQQRPECAVTLAFLELTSPTVEDALRAMAGQNVKQVSVIPLTLAADGHVRRELLKQLETIRRAYPNVEIGIKRSPGEAHELLEAIGLWAARESFN